MNDIAQSLTAVKQTIAQACERSKRDPAAITLIAVSKKQPASAIAQAFAAGQRDFGENYAQELSDKISQCSMPELRWHFIGRLQSNKAKQVVGACSLLHAVDSLSLASEIDKQAKKKQLVQDVLLAVNVADEASKSGFQLAETPAALAALAKLDNLRCRGFMTMPPLDAPERVRPFFRSLRQLAEEHLPTAILSMGTTGDFEVAIEEGATHLRVGTAIFGERT